MIVQEELFAGADLQGFGSHELGRQKESPGCDKKEPDHPAG